MSTTTDYPDSKGLRLKEAAWFWPCSVSTMRRMIREGVVRAYRTTPDGPLAVTVGELRAARERLNNPPAPTPPVPIDIALRESYARLKAEGRI